MKLTEKQRNIELAVIMFIIGFSLTTAIIYHRNLLVAGICTAVAVVAFTVDTIISFIEDINNLKNLQENHKAIISEIKQRVKDNTVDELTPIEANTVLEILNRHTS